MQTDARTTGLKACPFCGNPDLVVSLQPFIGGLSFGMVECEPCALTLREDDEEQAVARWNTRPPALETQGAHEGVIEALEPFISEIDRLERDYGFDRPLHQGQCLMLPLSALLALRNALSSGKTVSAGEGEG